MKINLLAVFISLSVICGSAFSVTLECDVPNNGDNDIHTHFIDEISTKNGWEIYENTFIKKIPDNDEFSGQVVTISRGSGRIDLRAIKNHSGAKSSGFGVCDVVNSNKKKF